MMLSEHSLGNESENPRLLSNILDASQVTKRSIPYFYEKAFLMGCLEAGAYMEQEYATGRKSVVEKVVNMLAQTENLS